MLVSMKRLGVTFEWAFGCAIRPRRSAGSAASAPALTNAKQKTVEPYRFECTLI